MTHFKNLVCLSFMFALPFFQSAAGQISCVGKPSDDTGAAAFPSTHAGMVLRNWLEAHNLGEESALRSFIVNHYATALLETIDMEAHVGFYREAIPMFGRLESRPYRIALSENHRLIVHLLRSDLTGAARLDPLNITVVEIDMDPNQPEKMARGLGLGSLACMARR